MSPPSHYCHHFQYLKHHSPQVAEMLPSPSVDVMLLLPLLQVPLHHWIATETKQKQINTGTGNYPNSIESSLTTKPA